MTRNRSLRRLGSLVSLVSLLGVSGFALLGAACSRADTPADPADEHVGTATSNLDADQCAFFDVNGKDTICHHTGSTSHPFTIIKTSEEGCIHGHAGHALDYIAVGDPTCQGGGCLPVNAPCDATLACCDGLTCQSGTCFDPCGSAPCQNGGTCSASGSSYTCSCSAGFTGTNCQINIDDCAPNPCRNGGTCTDGVNSHTCSCTGGWLGANCDVDPCASLSCTPSDQCHASTCDRPTAQCIGSALPNGTSCNDGNAATFHDVCTAGTCAGTSASASGCPCGADAPWVAGLDQITSCTSTAGLITSGTWSGGTIGAEDPPSFDYCYWNTTAGVGRETAGFSPTSTAFLACQQVIQQAAADRGVTCCPAGFTGPSCAVPDCPCAGAITGVALSRGTTHVTSCFLNGGSPTAFTADGGSIGASPSDCSDFAGAPLFHASGTSQQGTACIALLNQYAASAGVTCQ